MYKFKVSIQSVDAEQRKAEIQRLENELESICSFIRIIPYNNVLTVNVEPLFLNGSASFIDDLKKIVQAYPN